MFQDDPLLVYGSPAQVDDTLDQLAAFGVDRIRVSVFWKILAPANDAKQKPNFDATDPAALPAEPVGAVRPAHPRARCRAGSS